MRTALRTLAMIVLIGSVCGCGKKIATVSGKVFLGGQPLSEGVVTLLGPDGVPRTAFIGSDGSYNIAEVPFADEAVFTVTPKQEGGGDDPNKGGDIKNQPKNAPEPQAPPPSPIKDIYQNNATSPLKLKIDRSVITHDLKLD